jgi:hypothetical protein
MLQQKRQQFFTKRWFKRAPVYNGNGWQDLPFSPNNHWLLTGKQQDNKTPKPNCRSLS